MIYIAEICKELENVEINSEQVTDKGICEILKKSKFLRFLDISGCPNFVGVAFADSQEMLASDKIRKITLGPTFIGAHAMRSAKDRIHSK